MARYEERHRGMREAVRGHISDRDSAALVRFETRTGPLVDELVAAVRALRDGTLDADNALQGCYVALAALDEASDG